MNQTENVQPVESATADLRQEQLAQVRELLPHLFSEGVLDPHKLQSFLGDALFETNTRFQFSWNGKSEAIQLLQAPTSSTLVPDPAQGVQPDTSNNIYIEGENLEVLKILRKPYFGRVKVIYIDPPYNTGNDFVYRDSFADPLAAYLQMTGQQDTAGNLLTSNTETSGRYHSAWLTMMYPRLFMARQLLREDGVIFVSIDDHELHHLRLIMNEIFGEENYLATFVWKRRSGAMDAINNVSSDHEYVLCYGRNATSLTGIERSFDRYSNPDGDPRGPWIADNLSAAKPGGNTYYAVADPETGYEYWPPKGRYWPYSPQTMAQKISEGRIIFPGRPDGSPLLKRFKNEAKSRFRPVSTWIAPSNTKVTPNQDFRILQASINTEGTKEIKSLFDDKVFTYPKPVSLLKALIEQGTESDGEHIILDFFAGSCTTAQAVLELNREDGGNRRFIMVQFAEPTPEDSIAFKAGYRTVAEIGKERIRRVIKRMRGTQVPIAETQQLGFKFFALSPSNFKAWQGTAEPAEHDYLQQMALFSDTFASGWTVEGVITEVALREGLDLNSTVSIAATADNTVYVVHSPHTGQHFHICLDDHIAPHLPKELDLQVHDIFICRDTALTDSVASNLALQCRLKTL